MSPIARRDALGVLHHLERPARRIVSLVPSITETLFSIGAGAQVVGVTEWCVHPAAQVAALPKVGGTKDPRLDLIRELEPDLILGNIEENRREDIEQLAATRRVFVTFPQTLPETLSHVRDLGVLSGRVEGAAVLMQEIEAALGEVHRFRAARAEVRFLYLIWRKPYWAAGTGTYIDALLTAAGGRNVAAPDRERYFEANADWIAASAAELVVFPSEPLPFTETQVAEFAARFAELPAVRQARLRRANGADLSWFGARTPAGLRLAATLIRDGSDLPSGPSSSRTQL